VKDAFHALQGHHHFAIFCHCTAAQAGATAGGHQGNIVLVGEQHDLLHLLNGIGPHDEGGIGLPESGAVNTVGSHLRLAGDDVFITDYGFELLRKLLH